MLNKKFRSAQKTLDREVSHVQVAANELEKNLEVPDEKPVAAGEITRLLGGVVARLQVRTFYKKQTNNRHKFFIINKKYIFS